MKLSDDFNKYNEGFLCQNEACQMNMKLCHLQTSSLSYVKNCVQKNGVFITCHKELLT